MVYFRRLENTRTDNDICYNSVHPITNDIKNLVINTRPYNVLSNMPAAQIVIQPGKFSKYCSSWMTWDMTIFFYF